MPNNRDSRVLARDETFLAAIYRNVVISVWSGPPTLAKLESVGVAQREASLEWPNGFVALSLIRSISLKLPPEIRAAAERLSRETPPELRAVAQVVYGTGFMSAAMRSVVTGFQLIARRGPPTKVFDSLDGATEWLEPTVRDLDPEATVTAATLARAIRTTVSDSSGDETW